MIKKLTICIVAIFAFCFVASAYASDFVIDAPEIQELREESVYEGSYDDIYDGFVIDGDDDTGQTQSTDPSRPALSSLSVPAEFVVGKGALDISFTTNMEGQVFLTLFTNDMVRVGAITTKSFKAGDHKLSWNGTIDGTAISAGNYLIQGSLKSNDKYSTTVELPLRIDVIIPTMELKSVTETFTIGLKWQANVTVNMSGKLLVSLVFSDGTTYSIYEKACSAGSVTVEWDGKRQNTSVAIGSYSVKFRFISDIGLSHELSKKLEIKSTAAQVNKFNSPIVVLSTGEKTLNNVMSKPGGGTVLGKIYGSTVGVTVHSYSGNYAQISARDYDTNKSIKGYIHKSLLKTVEPTSPYAVVIDKKTQRLMVYKDGKLDKTMKCSTGLEMETPNGEFLTGGRLAGFDSHGLWVRYATRFNGGIYYHEIPSKNGDYTRYENQLGKKASAGCVRVPREYAKWLYDTIPKGSKVIVQ